MLPLTLRSPISSAPPVISVVPVMLPAGFVRFSLPPEISVVPVMLPAGFVRFSLPPEIVSVPVTDTAPEIVLLPPAE